MTIEERLKVAADLLREHGMSDIAEMLAAGAEAQFVGEYESLTLTQKTGEHTWTASAVATVHDSDARRILRRIRSHLNAGTTPGSIRIGILGTKPRPEEVE